MTYATHYHLHDGMELTLATLHDAPIHLAGMIAEARLPEVEGIVVREEPGEFGDEVIIVDHPETQVYRFVKVPCADASCATRLADYWL